MPRSHSKLWVIQFQVAVLASGFRVAEPSNVPTCCFFISPDDASSNARALSEGLLKLARPTRNLVFFSFEVFFLYLSIRFSNSFVAGAGAITMACLLSGWDLRFWL